MPEPRETHAAIDARRNAERGGGGGDWRCQDCMHTYLPWFTSNGLWNRVMGGPDARDDPGGCLCPRCFMDRADVVYPRLVWRLAPSDPATDTGGEAHG